MQKSIFSWEPAVTKILEAPAFLESWIPETIRLEVGRDRELGGTYSIQTKHLRAKGPISLS